MSTQFTNRQWRLPNNENKDKQSNYSMDFDGSSQYIELNSSVLLPNQHTVSTWIKSNDLTSSAIAYVFTTETTIKGIGLDEGDGSFGAGKFYYWNGGSPTTVSTTAITVNNWHHIVFVFDSTANEIKFYLDGNLDKTTTVSIGTAVSLKIIGSYNRTLHYLNGKLDAFSIFNYALSSSQITTLYGSSSTGIGNPMSLSPKPVAYYPLGDQDAFNGADYLVPNSSLKDYVFDFDAANNEYIDLGTTPFSFTQNLTISFWVKTSQIAPNSLIGKDNNVINGGRNWMVYSDSGIVKFWTTSSGSVSTLSLIESNTLVNDNQWHHIVCVNDYVNSTKQIYIDGSLDITNNNGAAISTSYSPVRIGIRDTTPQRYPYDGLMSNVALWDTALTGPQAETLYNNGSPIRTLANIPQNSNLQGWWKLDASDTYDSSTGNWTIEDHAGSNDGTSSGMTQANLVQSDLSFTSGYSPYALEFDAASNDKITASSNSNFNTGDLSASIWINASNLGNNIKYFFGNSNALATAGFTFSVNTSTGNAWYIGRATTTHMYVINNVSINFTNNVWNHLCFSYDDTTKGFILYLNGASVNSGTATSNTKNASGSIIFGGHNVNYDLTGKLSNASIWNTALTSAQVTEIYNEGVPSNLNNHSAYSNLVSWWQLGSNSSFNTNWTVLDEKGSNNGTSSNMGEDAIVDGVGSYANGLSSGMGGDEVIGDAPYSTANALSVNMDVEDRVTDTPS